MKLLVYTIVSSEAECRIIQNYLHFIKTPQNSKILVIDNSLTTILSEYVRIITHKREALNSIIVNYVLTQEYSHFCRLDPDDIDKNTRLLEGVDFENFDYVIPQYRIITSKKSFILNQQNGMGEIYELLGAGIILSKRVLKSCMCDLNINRGQDNYITWLELNYVNYKVKYIDSIYEYKIEGEGQSMSSQRERIINERRNILKSKLNKIDENIFVIAKIVGFKKDYWVHLEKNGKKFTLSYCVGKFYFLIVLSNLLMNRYCIRKMGVICNVGSRTLSRDNMQCAVILGLITGRRTIQLVQFDRTFSSYINGKIRGSAHQLHAIVAGLS